MSKEIKVIKILFENCESVTVPFSSFTKFNEDNNEINFEMVEDYRSFRIGKQNDICYIYKIYSDGSKEKCSVYWCESDSCRNRYQVNNLSEWNGAVKVTISKKKYLEREIEKCESNIAANNERLKYLRKSLKVMEDENFDR